VDFALALERYDLTAMQPHFPGYPVYVWAAMMVQKLAEEPYQALGVVSAASSGLTVWAMYRPARYLLGEHWAALAAAVLYAALPLGWVLGTQAMSDSLGTLFATAMVAAVVRAFAYQHSERGRASWLLVAGTLYGLLLGVRVSCVALGAVLVWAFGWTVWEAWRGESNGSGGQERQSVRTAWRDVVSAAAAGGLVCAAWGYALVVSCGGWLPFWQLATSFTGGHFTDWGGAYSAEESIFERLKLFVGRQIFAAGIGTPWGEGGVVRWGVLAGICVALAGVLRRLRGINVESLREPRVTLWMAWALPYALWAFLAQNVEKPRHVLPLMGPVVIGLVWGLMAFRQRSASAKRSGWRLALRVCLLVLAGSMASIGIGIVKEQRSGKPPMVQVAEFLQGHYEAEKSVVFTYEEGRVIRYIDPRFEAVTLRHWEDFRTEILNRAEGRPRVLLTDSVLKGLVVEQPWMAEVVREVGVFAGSPWLYPTYATIRVYEADGRLWERVGAAVSH
jgi:hypothetical protein